ncbi:hypothetical protein EVAR_28047_1 [Eumeta japonica]|uniref:Uncharacterized protein n=1 Tax=Eumeta variegata TaxID=151549 RepID=A0A4C1W570_EUMVA|nr:hypothetical protein EVAR_28047_1 [Eumeta japonica]
MPFIRKIFEFNKLNVAEPRIGEKISCRESEILAPQRGPKRLSQSGELESFEEVGRLMLVSLSVLIALSLRPSIRLVVDFDFASAHGFSLDTGP